MAKPSGRGTGPSEAQELARGRGVTRQCRPLPKKGPETPTPSTRPVGDSAFADSAGMDYPRWVTDRIRAELLKLRLAQGKSAHALAVPGLLTKQTILNIEKGVHSPSIHTFAVLCQRLGTTVDCLVDRAFGRLGRG